MKSKFACCGVIFGLLGLAGCQSVEQTHVEWEYVKPDSFPVVTAVGYAQISRQKGRDNTEKMLNAIKASKLEAYRELAEQVHGQRLTSQMSISDLVLQDDSLESTVQGVIRGAQVVKSYPLGDTYATELKLDMEDVYELLQASNPTRRIKEITYY